MGKSHKMLRVFGEGQELKTEGIDKLIKAQLPLL